MPPKPVISKDGSMNEKLALELPRHQYKYSYGESPERTYYGAKLIGSAIGLAAEKIHFESEGGFI